MILTYRALAAVALLVAVYARWQGADWTYPAFLSIAAMLAAIHEQMSGR